MTQPGLGKEVANVLLNLPRDQRLWVTENVPPLLFQTWCIFLGTRDVKITDRVKFYMDNPSKIFWKEQDKP